jgi:D-beta-D-heptose 7-phosphate kinase/D-beta-D-heptose 1-phosphate adenosyltransferase
MIASITAKHGNAGADHAALADIVARMPDVTVAVAGDAMLDRFVYGTVARISPEASIPVLQERSEARTPGGAGNVARNLAALGVQTRFTAAVGEDDDGRILAELLAAEPGLAAETLFVAGRVTTRKTRFLAGSQQLLRVDREDAAALREPARAALAGAFVRSITGAGAAVLSDYAKGALDAGMARELIRAADDAGVPVVVDPKHSDFNMYSGATVITPNRLELAQGSGMPVGDEEEIVAAARDVLARTTIGAILCTRSADGMTLVTADNVVHIAAEVREVFDVSGAGDTVTAVLAAALAAGATLVEAAELANAGAGIVVGKLGTAVAHPGEILSALQRRTAIPAAVGKLVSAQEARRRVAAWQGEGLRVGFTNGCFDLLHPGHVHLLASARAACGRLVVGLNDDASVRDLKGDGRPVQSAAARALVLGALETVDLVVLFDEPTPQRLIENVMPDVLFKGADYRREDVVGGDFVEGRGGKVVLIDLAPGYSTTSTIARMAH